ncbi:MAG: hypothetical protein WD941_06455, partial [Opitutus sp.]
VREKLLGLFGVTAVHDLHVWALDTTETALTAHLVVGGENRDRDALLHVAAEELHEHFEIRHVTLQLESEAFAETCAVSAQTCDAPFSSHQPKRNP